MPKKSAKKAAPKKKPAAKKKAAPKDPNKNAFSIMKRVTGQD